MYVMGIVIEIPTLFEYNDITTFNKSILHYVWLELKMFYYC